MGSSEERVVAVIMIGGPTKGTRFRPLSLNIPKPLFPLAGQPMVHHPISACKRIPNLAQIYLVGFYEEREFALFVSSISNELRVPVRYLKEDKPHGSAGGLYNFRDQIMEENPSHIFLLNCDVCCSFPLPEMLDAHRSYGGIGTILVIKVSPETANQFGELVADPVSNELLHYTEKPETFVSDRINVVCMSLPPTFTAIQGVSRNGRIELPSGVYPALKHSSPQTGRIAIPVIFLHFGKKKEIEFRETPFSNLVQPESSHRFCTTGSRYSIPACWQKAVLHIRNQGLLGTNQNSGVNGHHLASGDGLKKATISGDVYIHPSAKVNPTAKIGPNVSISANARIGAGARLVSCIVLDDVEIKENAVVIHAIVGWKSSIGRWSRVQGSGDYNAKLGVTILGESVTVEDEVVVINSIVLPNKTLNGSWSSNSRISRRGYCSGLVTGAGGMASAKIVSDPECISYLNQREAAEVDEILMGPLGFSVDQLMELAGLSVATSIAEVYKPDEHNRILAICGPGNNGGDGLVAARHLHHFVEDLPMDLSTSFDIVVDAIFWVLISCPRTPFDDLIRRMVALGTPNQKNKKSPVIVSVDIPSGWHVEEGDVSGEGIKPDMLVSLTAPKLCAKRFSGPHHFLGGRFVPPAIAEKFKLDLPAYPGTSMCVRIVKPPRVDISTLRENYISPEFSEDQVEADPFDQFQKWFDDAVASGVKEPNAMALSTTGKDGKPSSRMVLLKGLDKDGFVWYTNYESQKAHQISENPQAALLFYWDTLNRQVRVEGSVQKVSDEESEQYFHSRPRGSQIGAIVSKQLESLSVPFISIERLPQEFLNFDIVVDAIFGFSFQGNPRPPFDDLIMSMASLSAHYPEHQKSPVIVSVDTFRLA
ncbi:Pyridoxine/pyridoxamine 5'-phosphate oxidase 1, chloroplastic, partial [Sesamum angolense]